MASVAAVLPDTLSAIAASLAQANSALSPLLTNLRAEGSGSLGPAAGSEGLSLLALRPNLLLAYTHVYALLLAGALDSSSNETTTAAATPSSSSRSSVLDDFTASRPIPRPTPASSERALIEEAVLVREVMERVKGMEGKVQKQVDRLVRGAVDGGGDAKDIANGQSRLPPSLPA